MGLQENLSGITILPDCAQKITRADGTSSRLDLQGPEGPNLFHGNQAIYQGPQVLPRVASQVQNLMKDENPKQVVFFGFGLGLHLQFLRRHTAVPLVVYDPCPELLATALAGMPLDLPDVYLATTPEALSDILGSLMIVGAPRVTAGAIPAYKELFPEAFKEFCTVLGSCIRNQEIARKTKDRFALAWLKNVAANVDSIGRQRPFTCLGTRFAGKPAIFVGAGPSLDENLQTLKDASGRALILAAHTAVRPLVRAGITPDLVMIIEGQELTRYFAEPEDHKETILIAAPQTHPVHLTLGFKEYLSMCLGGNLAAPWLTEAFGDEPIPSGGSVACAAFSVLQILGCDPLICAGMDFAYSLGRSHASHTEFGCCRIEPGEKEGTVHSFCPEKKHSPKDYQVDLVTAWGGEHTVPASPPLSSFRHWFETQARTWKKDTTLVNANGAGARIHGFVEMTLDQALQEYGTAKIPTRTWIEEALAETPPRDPELFLACIRRELDAIEKAAAAARRADELATRAIGKLQRRELHDVQPVLDKVAAEETRLRGLTSKTRLLNTLVGSRAENVSAEKTSGDKIRMTINSLEQSKRISNLVVEGAQELLDQFRPVVG